MAEHELILRIPAEKVYDLIGPGGYTIRGLMESTGATIDVINDGQVRIVAADDESLREAATLIRQIVGL
jgi:polyribonucleotide nucleotidyltransferase